MGGAVEIGVHPPGGTRVAADAVAAVAAVAAEVAVVAGEVAVVAAGDTDAAAGTVGREAARRRGAPGSPPPDYDDSIVTRG